MKRVMESEARLHAASTLDIGPVTSVNSARDRTKRYNSCQQDQEHLNPDDVSMRINRKQCEATYITFCKNNVTCMHSGLVNAGTLKLSGSSVNFSGKEASGNVEVAREGGSSQAAV
eukprot:scaffold147962_cov17-Tisochrysis_lutea.AAC.1